MRTTDSISDEWISFIDNKAFPCVAAKAALTKQQQAIFVADHIACPKDDRAILSFIYDFVDRYRSAETMFHSAVVLFEQPDMLTEPEYERFFWQRLQALSDIDAELYTYDDRVSDNPESGTFSFSLKSEAFFIVGLHPGSSREARRFSRPAIVFNPHAQFEHLRENGQYEKMKAIIRKRDIALEGSINPMLEDFGDRSEVYQYTGRQLGKEWKCPLTNHHGTTQYNKSA